MKLKNKKQKITFLLGDVIEPVAQIVMHSNQLSFRHCIVDGKPACFHAWGQCKTLLQEFRKDGLPLKEEVETVGIVEFTNGTVDYVKPSHIQFTDDMVIKSYSEEG